MYQPNKYWPEPGFEHKTILDPGGSKNFRLFHSHVFWLKYFNFVVLFIIFGLLFRSESEKKNYNFNDSCIRNISNRFCSYATTGLEGHRKYLLLDYFGLFWPALNSDMGYAFPINASWTARFVKFMMQSRHCQDTLPNFYDFLYIR